jgi:hypothetical protein
MSDGIDTEMDAVQESACPPPARGGRADPSRAKIPPSDHSMLTSGDLGQSRVGCVHWIACRAIDCTHPSSLRSRAERNNIDLRQNRADRVST